MYQAEIIMGVPSDYAHVDKHGPIFLIKKEEKKKKKKKKKKLIAIATAAKLIIWNKKITRKGYGLK